jgi:hypothetical protein
MKTWRLDIYKNDIQENNIWIDIIKQNDVWKIDI